MPHQCEAENEAKVNDEVAAVEKFSGPLGCTFLCTCGSARGVSRSRRRKFKTAVTLHRSQGEHAVLGNDADPDGRRTWSVAIATRRSSHIFGDDVAGADRHLVIEHLIRLAEEEIQRVVHTMRRAVCEL